MNIYTLLLCFLYCICNQALCTTKTLMQHWQVIEEAINTDAKKELPPDVSFCIVDLKYNQGSLKICEFGQGLLSGFYGHQRLFGRRKITGAFNNYLNSLGKPVVHASFPNIKKGFILKNAPQTLSTTPLRSLSFETSDAIIISRKPHELFQHRDTIRKEFPNVIFIDEATRTIVLNKVLTHLLFINDPDIGQFRPQCAIVSTTYTPKLADEIKAQITSPYLVIKPINSFKGNGIVFLHKNKLDATLKQLFDKTKSKQKKLRHSFDYWQTHKQRYCIIESLEQSQPVFIGDLAYDATMRVAFAIKHNAGKIDIEFFGFYWKLPEQSLHKKCSLEKRYKSNVTPGRMCSMFVDEQTEQEVRTLLRTLLPKVYRKMLILREHPELVKKIRKHLAGNTSLSATADQGI